LELSLEPGLRLFRNTQAAQQLCSECGAKISTLVMLGLAQAPERSRVKAATVASVRRMPDPGFSAEPENDSLENAYALVSTAAPPVSAPLA
jgi:hypothetical protein